MKKASVVVVTIMLFVVVMVSAARQIAPVVIPPRCPAVLTTGHRLVTWEVQGLNHACIYAPPQNPSARR